MRSPGFLTPGQALRKTEVEAALAEKEERNKLKEERRKLAAEIEEREKLRTELKGKIEVAEKAISDMYAEMRSFK